MKENSTFRSHSSFQYNACVGKNGFNDIKSYEDGYDDTVKILLKTLFEKHYSVQIDTLVYPILFSARHRIELFLKKLVSNLEVFTKIKGMDYVIESRLNTHDLRLLWNYAEGLSKVDNRLKNDIRDLKEYIADYFDIDLTGETFRYPFNNENEHHLDEYSHINLMIFKKRYEQMSQIISTLDYSMRMLSEEYMLETFAGGLTRFEIEKISIRLPKRDTWASIDFDSIKREIKKEYNLSSGKLSEIINLIQNHKQFSNNIGILKKNTEIDKSTYSQIKQIRSDTLEKSDSKYSDLEIQFYHEAYSLLDENNCAALKAFYEIGYFELYSEQYEQYIKYYIDSGENRRDLFSLLVNKHSIDCIEKGIKICCQWHLL